MYAVFVKGRKLKGNFADYETARSYARKLLRVKRVAGKIEPSFFDTGWGYYSNPSINDYGYSVRRVK